MGRSKKRIRESQDWEPILTFFVLKNENKKWFDLNFNEVIALSHISSWFDL